MTLPLPEHALHPGVSSKNCHRALIAAAASSLVFGVSSHFAMSASLTAVAILALSIALTYRLPLTAYQVPFCYPLLDKTFSFIETDFEEFAIKLARKLLPRLVISKPSIRSTY
jgi:hypothetical protein